MNPSVIYIMWNCESFAHNFPDFVTNYVSIVLVLHILLLINSTLDDSGHISPTYPSSDYTMPDIKIINNGVFYTLSGPNPQKAYGSDGIPPVVPKNCASVLTPCLVKLFRLCLSTSIFPSCWKYAYVQPVPKKDDYSSPSNYQHIALLSCVSKPFGMVLNRKVLKHLSSSNLVSDCQYGFRKGRSTGDLLAFLTDSWSSFLSSFSETLANTSDISKFLIESGTNLNFLNYRFYPSLCSFISNLPSGRSNSDGHCSKPKSINSGVPQGTVLSPTFFLLFINNLSKTNCPIHS